HVGCRQLPTKSRGRVGQRPDRGGREDERAGRGTRGGGHAPILPPHPPRTMARVTTAPSTGRSSVVTGRDTDGNPLPSLRARMVPPMSKDTVAGWLAPIAIAVIAGALRVWHLGRPAKFVFDETY